MAGYIDKQVAKILVECPDVVDSAGTILTLHDLPFIRIAMIGVSTHWYNLGIHFDLRTNFLDEIRTKYRQNADRCLIAVLAEWLKNPSPRIGAPNWKKVVIAVASRVGGDNPFEARRIAKNFKQFGHLSDFKHLNEVDGTLLTSSDALSVKEALLEGVADKWIAIGLQLGVPYHRLELCEMEDTLSQRLIQMINEWLSRRYDTNVFGEPSWRKLIEVIASRAGGCHNFLANELAKQHPVQIMQTEDESYMSTGNEDQVKTHDAHLPGVLTVADLPILMKLLRPVASKWNLLGPQLGIQMTEIQIIMAKPMLLAGAPLSYMQETLYVWLQQKPPDYPLPTVNHLCTALWTDVIDEGTLTIEIEKYFVHV